MKTGIVVFALAVLPTALLFSKNAVEQTKCTNAASKEYAATTAALKAEHDAAGRKVGQMHKNAQTAAERLQEAKKKKVESKSNAHGKEIARFERLAADTSSKLRSLEPEYSKATKKYRDGTDAARKKMDAA